MTTTAADYIGRKMDLLAWQGVSPSGNVASTAGLVGVNDGGYVVAGIHKLAQAFLFELLTERGSVIYQPGRGTAFVTLARKGLLRTQLDAEQAFESAVVDIRRNLLRRELVSDPDDERYVSATLQNIQMGNDSLTLKILVRSRAGSERVVLTPIPTSVSSIHKIAS